MLADVDVFLTNYTIVDPEIYQLWIEGFSCKSRIPRLRYSWWTISIIGSSNGMIIEYGQFDCSPAFIVLLSSVVSFSYWSSLLFKTEGFWPLNGCPHWSDNFRRFGPLPDIFSNRIESVTFPDKTYRTIVFPDRPRNERPNHWKVKCFDFIFISKKR